VPGLGLATFTALKKSALCRPVLGTPCFLMGEKGEQEVAFTLYKHGAHFRYRPGPLKPAEPPPVKKAEPEAPKVEPASL
jgi:hypothetical protein